MNRRDEYTTTEEYWWFPKKKWSEDGAASLCFDCKVFCEREIIIGCNEICNDMMTHRK
jgi:hypothetical protein